MRCCCFSRHLVKSWFIILELHFIYINGRLRYHFISYFTLMADHGNGLITVTFLFLFRNRDINLRLYESHACNIFLSLLWMQALHDVTAIKSGFVHSLMCYIWLTHHPRNILSLLTWILDLSWWITPFCVPKGCVHGPFAPFDVVCIVTMFLSYFPFDLISFSLWLPFGIYSLCSNESNNNVSMTANPMFYLIYDKLVVLLLFIMSWLPGPPCFVP
jgi:hypothetical protein